MSLENNKVTKLQRNDACQCKIDGKVLDGASVMHSYEPVNMTRYQRLNLQMTSLSIFYAKNETFLPYNATGAVHDPGVSHINLRAWLGLIMRANTISSDV